MRRALQAGVMIRAAAVNVSVEGISFGGCLPVELS